jgi:hypothetical protein
MSNLTLPPAQLLEALTAVAEAIATTKTQPNTAICPEDGCLLIGAERCPACQVRNGPDKCECGRRLSCPEATRCWVCLRLARIAARRFCGCGREIRTDADRCSWCRSRAPRVRGEYCPDEDRPFHWVRRGGIMRPVFEEVA